ncbi:hypothetical protein ACLQ2R_17135 [Streptosporangium sp. DT93]|uniref:hypothetical protein n=1 Tax=Streptosporangium sp. DT93 TaxID=3393428 RepID=UPI003CF6B9CE
MGCFKNRSAKQDTEADAFTTAQQTDAAATARRAAYLIRESAAEHVRGNEDLSEAYKAVARAEIDKAIRPPAR